MKSYRIIIVLLTAAFMSGFLCTKVEYTNPLDNKGTMFAGDSAIVDDDGDGIVNYWDPDWPPNRDLKKSTPKIIFTGPDSVIIARDDPQKVLAGISVTATDSIWGNLTDSIKTDVFFYTSVCTTVTVTYSVKNPVGIESQRSRIFIVDCAPPDIVLKGENPLRLIMGTPYVEAGADASDNIDGPLPASKITIAGTVNTGREGIDTVTYTATDRAGNIGVQKRVVIVYKVEVRDTLKPILTLKGANPMTVFVNGTFVEPGYVAVDLPNYDTISASVRVTGLPVITSAPGYDTLTYTVADAANNIRVETRIINIKALDTGKDVTPPVITFLVCSQCTTKIGAAWTVPGYTAFDEHDGDVTNKVVKPAAPNLTVPGTTLMRYTVEDSAHNSATFIRYVTVVGINTDSIKPVINLTGDVRCTISVGKEYLEPGYTATDNVDLIISDKVARVVKNAAGTAVNFGEFYKTIDKYTITYTVSDAAGNQAVPAVRNVVVKDTTIDTTGGGLLGKYGVPLKTALPTINAAYKTSITTEGTGAPNISSITTFTINWDLTNKGLYQFSLNLNVSPHYLNLTPTNTFSAVGPEFTLVSSGVSGLDGTYYIVATATQCAWVSKTGKFAIIFK